MEISTTLAIPAQDQQFEVTPRCHFHTDVECCLKDYTLVKGLHARYAYNRL